MNRKIIIYIVVIIIILIAVFFSQQAVSGKFGQNIVSHVTNKASAYLAKGSDWIMTNVYSKIEEEVQNRGEAIQNGIIDAKQKVEDIPNKIESYFSGIKNAVTGNTNNNNCTTTAPTN